MTNVCTFWLVGLSLTGVKAAVAGPTLTYAEPCATVTTPEAVAPRATGADVRFADLEPVRSQIGSQGTANGVANAYEAIEAGDLAGADPHPMIPLPPAAWAAFVGLAGVAIHTARQQRPLRTRR